MIYQKDKLAVRKLTDEDAALLVKWLSDPTVLQYYEGRDRPHDMDKVRENFYPAEEGQDSRCLILYDNKPIGYIQFYPLEVEERGKYGYAADEQIFGMDQFIGETSYWNQGIGKLLVKSMVEYLIAEQGAVKIVMDPQTWNARAIACYERCGFKKKKLLLKHEWHEGEMRDCWLMEYS